VNSGDSAGSAEEQAAQAAQAEEAALEATLGAIDWPRVSALWRAGVGTEGVYRLLRLRERVRRRGPPALDGFAADPRAHFARWLVAHGRLHEGA
jgi:hypothetical protein